MNCNYPKNWDEFRWEKELRSDEMKIANYFYNLSAAVDLPAEEQIGMALLTPPQELIAVQNNSAYNNWRDEEECDEEEDNNEEGNLQPEYNAVDVIDLTAVRWNMIAAKLQGIWRQRAQIINCRFGHLILLLDDTFSNDNYPISLRLSLLKRSLHEINQIFGDLTSMDNIFSDGDDFELRQIFSTVGDVREELLAELTQLRNTDQTI